jgi:hypothetical protein
MEEQKAWGFQRQSAHSLPADGRQKVDGLKDGKHLICPKWARNQRMGMAFLPREECKDFLEQAMYSTVNI